MTTKNELKLLQDKLWAFTLAEADLEWATYGISEIITKLSQIKENLEKNYSVPEIEFENLSTFLGMHHYLCLTAMKQQRERWI